MLRWLFSFVLLGSCLGGAGYTQQIEEERARQPLNSRSLPTVLPKFKPEPPPKPQPQNPAMKPLALYGVPAILTQADMQRYKAIFAAIARDDEAQIERLSAEVRNKILMGHVLGQKLLYSRQPQGYDIIRMLRDYPRHPQARQIHNQGKAQGLSGLPDVEGSTAPLVIPALSKAGRYVSSAPTSKAVRDTLRQRIRSLVVLDDYRRALHILDQGEGQFVFDPTERDRMRAYIAGDIYYDGTAQSFMDAYSLAGKAARRHGKTAPEAHWIAGLSAWRMGLLFEAEMHFGRCAKSVFWTHDERAACAFWAGRSADANQADKNQTAQSRVRSHKAIARAHFEYASQFSNTFYGLLASLRLSKSLPLNPYTKSPSDAEIERLMRWNPGKRAFALLQVGEYRLAELELLMIARERDKELRLALLRVAQMVGLPELSARLAHYVAQGMDQERSYPYAALYPRVISLPQGGFSLDRALLWSIVRKESFYRPESASASGAEGYMQVTRSTADFLVKRGLVAGYDYLQKPEVNLRLGQSYLRYNTEREQVDGDLVKLLIAYNAGYGNLQKWLKRANVGTDALLLIESLPSRQTRTYLDRVLRNFIIYRALEMQAQPEALDLSRGAFAKLRRLD